MTMTSTTVRAYPYRWVVLLAFMAAIFVNQSHGRLQSPRHRLYDAIAVGADRADGRGGAALHPAARVEDDRGYHTLTISCHPGVADAPRWFLIDLFDLQCYNRHS